MSGHIQNGGRPWLPLHVGVQGPRAPASSVLSVWPGMVSFLSQCGQATVTAIQ